MSTCANHPIKMATVRCKACNKPLCNDCKRVTDIGIFCSEECETKVRRFQERADASPVIVHRTRFFTKRAGVGLIALVIVLVVVLLIMRQSMGINSFDDLKALLKSWWDARLLLLP